jgi:hypothetical protein
VVHKRLDDGVEASTCPSEPGLTGLPIAPAANFTTVSESFDISRPNEGAYVLDQFNGYVAEAAVV